MNIFNNILKIKDFNEKIEIYIQEVIITMKKNMIILKVYSNNRSGECLYY